MTGKPNHQELRDLLPAAALQIQDSSDLQRVLAHARDCQACTRLLAEYRDVAATIPLLIPDRRLDPDRSAALRSRLLARVRAEPRSETVEPDTISAAAPSVRASGPQKWIGWMGWGVAAGLAGLLLVHHSVHRPVDYGWFAAGLLTFLVIALGVYVRVQQDRLAQLRDRLAAQDRQDANRERPAGELAGPR